MADRKNRGIWTRQPFKALYSIAFVLLTTARLPILLAYYLPKSTRQHPAFDYKNSVLTELIRSLFRFLSVIEFSSPVSLDAGKEADRFVRIQPSDDKNTYSDVCLINPKIVPSTVGAVWYPSPVSAETAPKRVVLHFHSGAYVLLDGREAEYGAPCRTLAARFDCAVLCVEYRLASAAAGRGQHPAQLQDAISAYRYLLDTLQLAPSAILVSGDSAGGNLALMLLRYIGRVPQSGLPQPAALMLWSPWVDLARPADLVAAERANEASDIIPEELITWGIRALTGDGQVASDDAYISPLQSPFDCKVPLWVTRNCTERLAEQVRRLAVAMEDVGNEVALYDVAAAPHDIFTTSKSGYQREFADALDDAFRFFEKHGRI